MANTNNSVIDEIDIFKIIELLWNKKWVIILFVFFGLVCSLGYLHVKENKFESKIFYSVEYTPSYYDTDIIIRDFHKLFNSELQFKKWKQSDKDIKLTYKEFSNTKLINGYKVSTIIENRLAYFEQKKGSPYLSIRTNNPKIINDFFLYINHINDILNKRYLSRANYELNMIKSKFDVTSSNNNAVANKFFEVDRYIYLLKKGANTLHILAPTIPKRIAPRNVLVIFIALFFSLIISFVFVIIRENIIKKQLQKK
tara:strand:- start:6472 stop:7236 length:765 start_codon:yes stop_codon:yes gene_type:complete